MSLAGIWPSPVVELASAVVSLLVVWTFRAVVKLGERVAKLEGRLDERDELEVR